RLGRRIGDDREGVHLQPQPAECLDHPGADEGHRVPPSPADRAALAGLRGRPALRWSGLHAGTRPVRRAPRRGGPLPPSRRGRAEGLPGSRPVTEPTLEKSRRSLSPTRAPAQGLPFTMRSAILGTSIIAPGGGTPRVYGPSRRVQGTDRPSPI